MRRMTAFFCGVLIFLLGFLPSAEPAEKSTTIVTVQDTTLPKALGLQIGMSVKEARRVFRARGVRLVAKAPQSDPWNHGRYEAQGAPVNLGDVHCHKETALCFCNKGLAEFDLTLTFSSSLDRDKEYEYFKKVFKRKYGEPDEISRKEPPDTPKPEEVIKSEEVESMEWQIEVGEVDAVKFLSHFDVSISKRDILFSLLMKVHEQRKDKYEIRISYSYGRFSLLWTNEYLKIWEEQKKNEEQKEQKRIQKDLEKF